MSRLALGRLAPSEEQARQLAPTGRLVALAGAVLAVIAPFLAWSYSSAALDDMTVFGYPSPLQFCFLALGVLLVAVLVAGRVVPPRRRLVVGWNRAAKAAATAALVFVVLVLVTVAVQLGGLVNVVVGGWVALVGAVLAFVGTRVLPSETGVGLERLRLPAAAEIGVIAVVMALALFAAAFALGAEPSGVLPFLVFVAAVIVLLLRLGAFGYLSAVSNRHRSVLVLAAFVVAFAFPFTQNGSDANMSIATQVIIFGATAMGLNIVVGLAGLLDLGYIAFLGAGAFTSAILSTSAFSTVGWHPPFLVTVAISGLIAATLGLLIGSPTLRVSGDYLAIVTLAFGEIFRITMNNLDGVDGPLITRGSNGIPAIPNLNVFGFDLGARHQVFGIPLGRFSNYYFLLLLVMGLIILIFVRLNNSRIGRGWVAIREDEKAAEAMGVNVFGLKVFAFASGAFLAGVAGSVKAHVDVSATPDQYVFLQSAFLLAAIVLGGMGTVLGVLVGATLLQLLPEKLRAVNDYRLLIFGLLLVVMMRFRPEGLFPNTRRQLEFHDEDEELAEQVDEEIELGITRAGIVRDPA